MERLEVRMNVTEARAITDRYLEKLTKEHEDGRREYLSERDKQINIRKVERWEPLIAEIEAIVLRRASIGGAEFLLDEIYYLKDGDQILLDELLKEFKSRGFKVKEYQYSGIHLAW